MCLFVQKGLGDSRADMRQMSSALAANITMLHAAKLAKPAAETGSGGRGDEELDAVSMQLLCGIFQVARLAILLPLSPYPLLPRSCSDVFLTWDLNVS